MVWLYNHTRKSVFAAALLHAVGNVCWQLFPNQGSHFDPRIDGMIVAVEAAVVTVVWGRKGWLGIEERQPPIAPCPLSPAGRGGPEKRGPLPRRS